MKKVLILGAGLVARPLVRYLLDQPDFNFLVSWYIMIPLPSQDDPKTHKQPNIIY